MALIINFNYAANVTAALKTDYFAKAAATWTSLITGAVGVVGDYTVTINVDVPDLGGQQSDGTTTMGNAAPTTFDTGTQTNTGLTLTGDMSFNSQLLQDMITKNTFMDTVVHEMAHVLGFGTIWVDKGVKGVDGNYEFTGTNAIGAFQTLLNDKTLLSIPLAQGGGAGSAGSHWAEPVFNNEMMLPSEKAGSVPRAPISTMTLASFQDLGYTVDYSKIADYAGTYVAPASTTYEMGTKNTAAAAVTNVVLSNLKEAATTNTSPTPTDASFVKVIWYGTQGNDSIDGVANKDVIYALGGNDTVNGGVGDDTISGGAGNDVLDGGAGTDTALYADSWVKYDVTGNNTAAQVVAREGAVTDGGGTDTLNNMEKITFFAGDKTKTITVSLADAINVAPVAVADSNTVLASTSAKGNVLSNDTDANSLIVGLGETKTVTSVTIEGTVTPVAATGVTTVSYADSTLSISANGEYTYAMVDPVTISYTMSDAHGLTSTSTLSITITDSNTNTAPTLGAITANNVVQADAGKTSYSFDVAYADGGGGAINQTTIDARDVTVTSNGTTLTVAGATWNAATGKATYTVTPPTGKWTDASIGTYTIGIVASEVSDNQGAFVAAKANAQTFTVNMDTTPPVAPSFTLTTDTGRSATDGVTQNTGITVSGLEANASWQYSTNAGKTWSAAQAASTTSFNLTEKVYAVNDIQVRQADLAGNVSTAGKNAAAITIDTTAPAAPTIALTADTGRITTDGVTQNTGITVSGLEANATWEYSTDAGKTWSAAQAASTTSFNLTEKVYAINDVQVRQTDLAGNVSTTGKNAAAITIDTTAPAAPTLGAVNNGVASVSGIEATATWQYTSDNGKTWSAAQAATTTSFTLAAGTYGVGLVQIKQTDLAGNLSKTANNPAAISVIAPAPAPAPAPVAPVTPRPDVTFVQVSSSWTVATSHINGYTLVNNAQVLILDTGISTGTGDRQNNYLLGNSLDNTLNGGAGDDVMAAYAGNDLYIVDSSNINADWTVNHAKGDIVVEAANEGTDTVNSSVSYALRANIENLVLTGNAVAGFGNDSNNLITGNAADNVIAGGAGVDTMIGGAGNDVYYVDNSSDVITEVGGEGTDIVFSTATNYTLSDNVEHLIVWGNGLNGTGNAGNNIIYGNALNNTLVDGAGTDILVGGRGQDTYNLSVDNTTDTVYISVGDSLTSSYDIVNSFNLNATGKDRLDLPTTSIASNMSAVGGTSVGSIIGASISNGIISFQGVGGATIAAGVVSFNDAITYVQNNITGGNTVAFVVGADTFVFQDGTVDTLVDLVGVTATAVNTTGVGAGAVWIV